ncbi:MAG: hypothetical protein M3P91_10265 [Actinomycetota bacterium]|nr:hypothetical protein [Actinomycetota bacterium]
MSRSAVAVLACAALLSGCTSGEDGSADGNKRGTQSTAVLTSLHRGPAVVEGGTAAQAAASTSRALFDSAPVVVLADADDAAMQARAASAAVQLGAPMLVTSGGAPESDAPESNAPESAGSTSGTPTPPSESADHETADPGTTDPETTDPETTDPETTEATVRKELDRLSPEAVLTFGADVPDGTDGSPDVVRAATTAEGLAQQTGASFPQAHTVAPAGLVTEVTRLERGKAGPLLTTAATGGTDRSADRDGELPRTALPAPLQSTLVVVPAQGSGAVAAAATARAAGAEVVAAADGDLRGSGQFVTAVSTRKPASVVAIGDAFGTPEAIEASYTSARTGQQLPGGGQLVLPGKRYIALYGYPNSAALGVLGEQAMEETFVRARKVAAEYEPHSDLPVIPTLEIITTVASASAGGDGDYSSESEVSDLTPWVDAAAKAGIYVVLDLQPGTTDFLTQAKLYEPLLTRPNVGLALDPEWRLKPGQRHMRQIGSVSAQEVNAVADWLAELTARHQLPQKMLLLHQFKLSMLADRQSIDMSRAELALVVQMDGHGPTSVKFDTWDALRAGAQPEFFFGWKNFYDEDMPTLTPAQTMAVRPTPWFVSYQ